MSDFTASSAPVERLGPTTVCSGICCGTTFFQEWRIPVPAEALASHASGWGFVQCSSLCVWSCWTFCGLGMTTAGHSSQFCNLVVLAILACCCDGQGRLGGFADERERMALSAKVLRSLHVQGRPLPLSLESLYM